VVDHGGAWIPRRSTPRHAAATRFADIGSPFVGCHVDADGGSRTPTDRCLRPVPLPGWATSACDVDTTDMRGRGTRTTGARRSRAGKRSASSAAQRRRQTQLGSIRVFSRDAPAAPVGGGAPVGCVTQRAASAAYADRVRRRVAPAGVPRAARPSPGAPGPASGHAERRRDEGASRLLSYVGGRRAACPIGACRGRAGSRARGPQTRPHQRRKTPRRVVTVLCAR
jgi:hypothetical protein